MSRLGDAIRRASRREAAPLGFGAAAGSRASPSMLCLALLPAGEASRAGEAAARGAAAVILDGADPARLGEGQELKGIVWGARPARADRETVAGLARAGADFIVLDREGAAEALLEEGPGFILALDQDLPDSLLRTLETLPLDALLLPPLAGDYTLERLLALRRISLLSRTPLIVPTDAEASTSRLHALREAGVVAVLVEGKGLEGLPALRQRIEALPARGRRREERPEPVLPGLTPSPAPVGEEETEDE